MLPHRLQDGTAKRYAQAAVEVRSGCATAAAANASAAGVAPTREVERSSHPSHIGCWRAAALCASQHEDDPHAVPSSRVEHIVQSLQQTQQSQQAGHAQQGHSSRSSCTGVLTARHSPSHRGHPPTQAGRQAGHAPGHTWNTASSNTPASG